MNYKEIVEFDTKLTADVVAWRPETNLNNKTDGFVLACGTYFLDKEKNSESPPLSPSTSMNVSANLINFSNRTNKLKKRLLSIFLKLIFSSY